MTVTVEIDLNCRIGRGMTFTGIEDASGPVEPGDVVHVHAIETDLRGAAHVVDVDHEKGLIYLSIAWNQLSDAYSPAAARRIADRLRDNGLWPGNGSATDVTASPSDTKGKP